MPASGDISFELERFEWASPDRLEVEGRWHGVRRRLARATLVVEVDGKRRRLRALAEEGAGSPERWVAAFPWEGEMPKLPGAELEVGRGIVVDLPSPRRSKARGAADVPAEPIPATSREERDATPGREEAERLLAVLTAARAEADEAAARAAAAAAAATAQRERAEAAEAELASTDAPALRARAEEVEAELEAVRGRADSAEGELEAVRGRADSAEAELEAVVGRAEAAETELTALRARTEPAETEPAVAPDVERLRAELQTAERERIELRAQLDATAERLEAIEEARAPHRHASREAAAASANTSERTQAMPGPRTAAAGGARVDGRESESDERPLTRSRLDRPTAGDTDAKDSQPPRRTRRPAERTARRPGHKPESAPAESSGPPLGERISDWVASLTGSRTEAQNGRGETEGDATRAEPTPSAGQRTERARAAQVGGTGARTRRRADRRSPHVDDRPSWPLRVVAIGLLALLMVALVVIVFSLL